MLLQRKARQWPCWLDSIWLFGHLRGGTGVRLKDEIRRLHEKYSSGRLPWWKCKKCGAVAFEESWQGDKCLDCGGRGWHIEPHCPIGCLAIGAEESFSVPEQCKMCNSIDNCIRYQKHESVMSGLTYGGCVSFTPEGTLRMFFEGSA